MKIQQKILSLNEKMGKSASSYADNVFINCPFDDQYKPIFNAIVFAIHDAGFVARCSLEVLDSGHTRLKKLLSIIAECKYGIHDISRTEIGGKAKLPRFNMPFECGLFWGCFEYGEKKHKSKRILVLDSEEFRYRASLSDIAGQDIQFHNNDARMAVDKVRSWLNTDSRRRAIPGGEAIWEHYLLFQNDLTPMLKRAGITRSELESPAYYSDYVTFVVEWLKEQQAKGTSSFSVPVEATEISLRDYFEQILRSCAGNEEEAIRRAGVSKNTFYIILKELHRVEET